MHNYLKKIDITRRKLKVQDYSLSNNNIDNEYSKLLMEISVDKITELINKYPDYRYRELKESIKKEFRINKVVLGCGSEDLIIRTNFVLKNKGNIGIFLPNFYRIMETAENYKKIYTDYKIDSDFIDIGKVSIDGDIKSVWISNPNPMIGKLYKKDQLVKLIRNYNKTLFIIDESAIDFIENSRKISLIGLSQKLDNLIVIRSFSKLYGAAGLRVGFATGKIKKLEEINKLGLTFPVSGVAECFIKMVIKNKVIIDGIRRRVFINKNLLERLLLKNKNIIVSRSVVNCVVFKHKKLNIFRELLKINILSLSLDDQDGVSDKGFVRLTVHSSKILFNNLYYRISKLLKNI